MTKTHNNAPASSSQGDAGKPPAPDRKASPAQKARPEPAKAADKGKPAGPHGPNKPAKPLSCVVWALLFMLIALAVALGASVYLWQLQQQIPPHLAALEARLAQSESIIEQQQRQLSERDQLHQQRFDRLESLSQDLPEHTRRIAQLEQQLHSLQAQIPRQIQAWGLAEVEYLLRLADHSLRIELQPDNALNILHSAANILALGEQEAFIPLQDALARDIQRIRVAPYINVEDLSTELTTLTRLVPRLTLKPLHQPVESTTAPAAVQENETLSRWQHFLQRVWGDLRNLVVIRHQRDEWQMPPLPEQLALYQWTLQIRLEAAQPALLARQQQSWHASLMAAHNWLTAHFDPRNPAWEQLDQGLQRLADTPLRPPLPDLQDSLRQLELLQGEPAPGTPQEAPDAGEQPVQEDNGA